MGVGSVAGGIMYGLRGLRRRNCMGGGLVDWSFGGPEHDQDVAQFGVLRVPRSIYDQRIQSLDVRCLDITSIG